MSKTCDKILVIRLSALGDVAMVIPVLYPICREYPQKEFTLLTSPVAAQLYVDTPENLIVKSVNTKKEYKGLKGIFRLFGELKSERFDAVADLHDVLRSKILSLLFKIKGVKVFCNGGIDIRFFFYFFNGSHDGGMVTVEEFANVVKGHISKLSHDVYRHMSCPYYLF